MTVYDQLGRAFRFRGVYPVFLPAGGLELRYAPDSEDSKALAAYFPAGGWVAIVEGKANVTVEVGL